MGAVTGEGEEPLVIRVWWAGAFASAFWVTEFAVFAWIAGASIDSTWGQRRRLPSSWSLASSSPSEA